MKKQKSSGKSTISNDWCILVQILVQAVFIVAILINEYFDEEKLSLRDKIINALNASPMTKTELCRYLGYARVANSASHQLMKLITDNQVIEINKKYHLK